MNARIYIKDYEKAIGRKATKIERRFAEGLLNIGANFEAKGREDGAKGLPVPGAEVFTHWANKVFADDAELSESVAEYMQMAYMHGYKEGGGVIE